MSYKIGDYVKGMRKHDFTVGVVVGAWESSPHSHSPGSRSVRIKLAGGMGWMIMSEANCRPATEREYVTAEAAIALGVYS